MSASIARLCRLCLHNVGDYGNKIDIFGTEDTHEITLATKISACIPLSLDSNDNLPKFVCKACCYKVDSFYNFRAACIKSELYLHEQLSGYEICDVQIEYCQNDGNNTYLQNSNVKTLEIDEAMSLSQVGCIGNEIIPMEVDDSNLHAQQELIKTNENQIIVNACTQNSSQVIDKFKLDEVSSRSVSHDKNVTNIELDYRDQSTLVASIETHNDLQENVKSSTLKCTLCSSYFNVSSELQSHLIENHSIEINKISDTSRFQEIQNSRLFNYNKDTSFACIDMNSSSLKKDFNKSECGDIFNEEVDLKKRDLEKHLKYTPALSICYKECDDTLKSNTTSNHSSLLDLKCLHCSFKSKNPLAVESHQRHCYKQNWPFPCSTCKERFLLDEDLQTHKDEIHKVSIITCPYNCSLCDNKFLNNIDLKVHQNLHTPFKKENKEFKNVPMPINTKEKQDSIIFVCNFCNENFVQKSSIEYHMLVHLAERERLSVFVKQLCL